MKRTIMAWAHWRGLLREADAFKGFGPREYVQALRGGECDQHAPCLLYTSPSPRDRTRSRMPSSA